MTMPHAHLIDPLQGAGAAGAQQTVNARPATPPAAAAPRITYGALWDLCDGGRQNAALWGALCAGEAARAAAKGEAAAAELYSTAAQRHAQRAAEFEALQKLVGRVEASETIKDELKRIAARGTEGDSDGA